MSLCFSGLYIHQDSLLFNKISFCLCREAQEFAEMLLKESKWSKATYAYQKACCMCMRMNELTEEEREDLRETMK